MIRVETLCSKSLWKVWRTKLELICINKPSVVEKVFSAKHIQSKISWDAKPQLNENNSQSIRKNYSVINTEMNEFKMLPTTRFSITSCFLTFFNSIWVRSDTVLNTRSTFYWTTTPIRPCGPKSYKRLFFLSHFQNSAMYLPCVVIVVMVELMVDAVVVDVVWVEVVDVSPVWLEFISTDDVMDDVVVSFITQLPSVSRSKDLSEHWQEFAILFHDSSNDTPFSSIPFLQRHSLRSASKIMKS